MITVGEINKAFVSFDVPWWMGWVGECLYRFDCFPDQCADHQIDDTRGSYWLALAAGDIARAERYGLVPQAWKELSR